MADVKELAAKSEEESDEFEDAEEGMTAAYSMTDLLDGLDDDTDMLDPDIESSVEVSVGSDLGKAIASDLEGVKEEDGDVTLTGANDSSKKDEEISKKTGDDCVNDESDSKSDKDGEHVVDSQINVNQIDAEAGLSLNKDGDAKIDDTKLDKNEAGEDVRSINNTNNELANKADENVQDNEGDGGKDDGVKADDEVFVDHVEEDHGGLQDSIQIIVENDVYESADIPPKTDNVQKDDELSENVEMVDNEIYGETTVGELYEATDVIRTRKSLTHGSESSAGLDTEIPLRESASSAKEESSDSVSAQAFVETHESESSVGLDTEIPPRESASSTKEDSSDSKSARGSPETGTKKLKSDISGRFFVEGAEYSDQKESLYYNERVDSSGNCHYENYYSNVADERSATGRSWKKGTYGSEELYENVGGSTGVDEDPDDGGWSSFESYDEDEDGGADEKQTSQRSQRSKKGKVTAAAAKVVMRSSVSPPEGQSTPNMLDKLAARLSSHKPKTKDVSAEDDSLDESLLVEVILSAEKHPPPELPPAPDGLTPLQLKRRQILASIVDSERSYTSSLRRIIEEYEKPLLEAKPHILSKASIKLIFYKVRDILQCHNMFQIELAEHVRVWDVRECVGNVFTASFSKSVVFDAYSAFVNNFTVAMETAKKQARTKQAFAEFIRQRLVCAADKLSLFGLMVKPVQRFPQFIMLLQDLLHQTPREHADRLPLQRALTELETLTHKLNETKREAENRHDVKRVLHHMSGKHTIKSDALRYMIRTDDMVQVNREPGSGETKTKERRLFLMNDHLVCASIVHRDPDSGCAEKYKLKWAVPVGELEVVETPINPSYHVRSGQGRTVITTLKTDSVPVEDTNPFRRELDDLLHDLPVVEQIGRLVSQLRRKYQGLNAGLVHAVTRSLQIHIQHKSDVDRCILQLALPNKYLHPEVTKLKKEMSRASQQLKLMNGLPPQVTVKHRSASSGSASSRHTYVFQVAAPGIKQDWLQELQNVRLALDPRNNPSWMIPESELQFTSRLPLFIKPLLINITNHQPDKKSISFKKKKFNMQVECACVVVLPSPDLPGVGVQHLWVCTGDKGRSQVCVFSLHGAQQHVVESFRAPVDELVLAVTMVPGAGAGGKHAFPDSTVWMGTDEHNIVIVGVEEETRGEALHKLSLDARVLCLQYLDGRVFAGLKNGSLVIFTRDYDGVWNFKSKTVVKLGKDPVTCLLPIGHEMWVAAGHTIHAVSMTTQHGAKKQEVTKVSHTVGSGGDSPAVRCMVRAGVGLMVAFSAAPVISLYHLETMEHLQDVSVKSGVNSMLQDTSPEWLESARRSLHITCLLASRGLLWVGTNVGLVMTLPLPRLEGVPQMKGRPTISHHSQMGPIRFLAAVHCGICALPHSVPPSLEASMEHEEDDITAGDSPFTNNGDDMRGFSQSTQSAEYSKVQNFSSFASGLGLASSRSRWISTPDVRTIEMYAEPEEDLQALYGSLLNVDDDFELYQGKGKRKSQNLKFNMQLKANALNAKISQTVSKFTGSGASPQSKYATLPILSEDAAATNGNGFHLRHDLSTMEESDIVDNESGTVTDSASVAQDSVSRTSSQGSQDGASSQENSSSVVTSNETTSSSGGVGGGHFLPASASSHESSTAAGGVIMRPKNSAFSRQSQQEAAHKSVLQSQHSTVLSQQAMGKSLIIASGGAGHVNWRIESEGKGLKHEDLCLLLWKCRV